MKQLIPFRPIFTPGLSNQGTLDFSTFGPGFSVNKLYAIIDVTQNAPLYVAGAPGYGITSNINAAGGTVITLSANTAAYSTADSINVYYDTAAGYESNTPLETGGQLQRMQENIEQILVELKVMNIILAQGLNINIDDAQQLRNDVNRVENQQSVF